MFESRVRIYSALAFSCVLCLLLVLSDPKTVSRAGEPSSDIQTTRKALEKYQDVTTAIRDGYLSTVVCIDYPSAGTLADMPYPAGGMGVHFINFSTVGPKLDPLKPQVLMYDPVADNKLRLVAAEWFMPLSLSPKERPALFGHPFYGPMMGHYPVMPAQLTHYDLHVWLWQNNPAGMFSPTNPAIKCKNTGYYQHAETPKMPMGHM